MRNELQQKQKWAQEVHLLTVWVLGLRPAAATRQKDCMRKKEADDPHFAPQPGRFPDPLSRSSTWNLMHSAAKLPAFRCHSENNGFDTATTHRCESATTTTVWRSGNRSVKPFRVASGSRVGEPTTWHVLSSFQIVWAPTSWHFFTLSLSR